MAAPRDPWQNPPMNARLFATALGMMACVSAIAGSATGAPDIGLAPKGGIWKAVVPLETDERRVR